MKINPLTTSILANRLKYMERRLASGEATKQDAEDFRALDLEVKAYLVYVRLYMTMRLSKNRNKLKTRC